MASQQRFLRRCRLLDAARGLLNKDQDIRKRARRPLPTFALTSQHCHHGADEKVGFSTPSEFHKTLCDAIQQAQERVYIASLYIGPAADPTKQPKEQELLTALQNSSASDIKILLDQNRALRPVPMPGGDTTSSAKAASLAAQSKSNNNDAKIHLFQVLSTPLASLLPNPLNEVAGVFHIKLYIVDDLLILSGANLSEEYFVDRQDRYFVVEKGGNGLVDFYAKVMDVLCNHSATYHKDGSHNNSATGETSRNDLLQELNQLFQDDNPKSAQELLSDPDIVAVCIPTFHAPKGFWSDAEKRESGSFFGDLDATLALLDEGAKQNDDGGDSSSRSATKTVQLSSAYLNPTQDLIQSLADFAQVDMVTAGRQSHGFKPKPKAGNKGKDWIPTVFDHLQTEASKVLPKSSIWHWERPNWTFHSKGIWLQQSTNANNSSSPDAVMEAAIVGSSNFGGRSFLRDMESNMILVFPPDHPSPIADQLQQEWREMLSHSTRVNAQELLERAPPLPVHIRSLLPYIKSFF